MEKRLDYLFNINNIIKIKSGVLRAKFLRWREMNIYKVSQELRKEFEGVVEKDKHMQSLTEFQRSLSGSTENKTQGSSLDLGKMFGPFDNLIDRSSKKLFARKLAPQENLIREEDEEDEEDENVKRIHQVMSRKGSLGKIKKHAIKEEDEDRESVNQDQKNLEDFIAQERGGDADTKKSQDSFNVNQSLTEAQFNSKEQGVPGGLIQKIYQNQMEKSQANQIGLSFGPSNNFGLHNKTMSVANDSKNSLNNTKSKIFDNTYDSNGSEKLQKKTFDIKNSGDASLDGSGNFMVLNSLNENDTLGIKSGEFTMSDMSNQKTLDNQKHKVPIESLDNLREDRILQNSTPNLDMVLGGSGEINLKNRSLQQASFGSDIMLVHKKSKHDKTKRILELHYNLLFALANHAKKLMLEGYNALQEEILTNYTKKTFENLIYFIESKMDFKKVVNLICLINFTNHGFYRDEYDEIILKIVQNFHIRCVYVLLKMDSFGFFSIKNDIFGVSDKNFKNRKKNLFGGQGTLLDKLPLLGNSKGVKFSPLMGTAQRDEQKILNFKTLQAKQV